MTAHATVSLAAVMLLTAAAGAAHAQTPLDAARDLYSSAAFEEALNALSRLDDATTPAPVARQADEYRLFSLIALGRTSDAEAVAETLIRREPFGTLQSADASPRIRALYTTVRTRLLPTLVREQYRAGRAAVEAKAMATASQHFADAKRLIADARTAGSADSGLDDLGELVDGFLLLATAKPASTPADPAPATPPMPSPSESQVPALSAPPGPAPSASSSATTEPGPRIYTIADADVTPPAALLQVIPALPPPLRVYTQPGSRPLILNLLIDESGRVRRSSVVVSVNPAYDSFVINAVAQWRYRPAQRGAVAVPYEKVVAIR
jgi:hypothetical protein